MDNIKERVAWHPGFFSGMKLTLRENQNDLYFQPGQELNQEPLRTDMLVIEKHPGVEIKKSIGHIFRIHNILEYKGVGDDLNIDTLHKLIAYTALYKAQGEYVNLIPGTEITATVCRNAYPRKMFQEIHKLGARTEERYPGIFYVTGLVYFPVQIVIFNRLDPAEYPELTMLNRDVAFENFKRFFEQKFPEQGDRNDASAFLHVVLAGNPELIEMLKEDSKMYKVVEDFLDPEYKESVRRKVTEEVREKIRDEVREEGIEIGEKRGISIGEERGKITTLLRLIQKGRLTVEEAAEDCNMSEEDFTEQYLTPASA